MLQDKRLVVGITGSIAAYKAVELVRALRKQGAQVQCCLTAGAQRFVTSLTFEALSQQPCIQQTPQGQIAHVEVAHHADALIIAPASANCIAKLAHGYADEALYQVALSFAGPLIVAPAMETGMWYHPATQANIALLRQRGVLIVEPEEGELASGREGKGRLAELPRVLGAIQAALMPQDFASQKVLITAGPTVEDLDPVRFISNRSSGKMGISLAQAFIARGAEVLLVHGPLTVSIPALSGLRCEAVRSAEEMFARVMEHIPNYDIAVCCAAVADYKPAYVAEHKLKKSDTLLHITLQRNPDILASIGALPKRPFTIGFAAETTDMLAYALDKCRRKNCDLICANDVLNRSIGFDSAYNALTVVDRQAIVAILPQTDKQMLAHQLLDIIAERYLALHSNAQPDDGHKKDLHTQTLCIPAAY